MDETDDARDVLAIRTVFEAWYCAMEDGDVDRLTSLVTNDVIVKPPDAAPVAGKDALQQALGTFLETHSETVDYDIQEVEVCGRLGFAFILESAQIRPRSGGDATSMQGMHLSILRRQPDGEWLIARDISSLIGSA